MTEEQLRDNIIVKMLDYRDRSNIDINEFCSTNKIDFSSGMEMNRIFKNIRDEGYITANFIGGGGGYFTITYKGIGYAESLLKRPMQPLWERVRICLKNLKK